MSVFERCGDIFDSKADILCHQVNYHGVMGAGIAVGMKARMAPHEFDVYKRVCKAGSFNLGNVLYSKTEDGRVIANCFSQIEGTTSYDMFRACMTQVERKAHAENKTVAIPYKMGCGIACGDWNTVYRIILDVFENSVVPCEIYALEGLNEQ